MSLGVTTAGKAPDLHHEAEELAANFPPLLVAAERVASTVSQGVHGRRRVGQGETFWQFRRYEWGDPTTAIDWRQSAKADPLYVRETEWEAAQTVWLWCEHSQSMAYRASSDRPEKRARADLMALALAALLIRGGERVALLDSLMAPTPGRAALLRLAALFERRRQMTGRLPEGEFLLRHSRVVLFGDFLSPLDEVERMVSRFSNQGAVGHLVQVLDPAEETLPFEGRVEFEEAGGAARLLIGRVESIRDAYREAFAAHQAGLRAIAQAHGWSLVTHLTENPPERTLMTLYIALSDRSGR